MRSIGLMLLLIFASVPAFAAENTSPPLRIGVLDFQQLLTKAPQAEIAAKRIEDQFRPQQEKLMAKQNEFQTKQKKWQRDRDTMADAERVRLEKDLNKVQQEIRRLDEEYRSEKTALYMDERDNFMALVREVVDSMSRENKYDLVLLQEAALYIDNRIDITNEVLDRLAKLKSAKSSDTKKH